MMNFKKNILNQSIELCCGCGACSNICPKNAIILELKHGFYYPIIDKQKCIDCGLCTASCQINNYNIPKNAFKPYLIKVMNESRMQSSSGGAAYAIEKEFLCRNLSSAVCGVMMDDNLHVKHCLTKSEDLLECFQGSKYVQSNKGDLYNKIASVLSNGEKVLFTGTSCECEAVYLFLKAKHIPIDNLYTIAILCHGAASPYVFEKYISELERKNKSRVKKFLFRDKNISWRNDSFHVIFENEKHLSRDHFLSSYRELYIDRSLNIRNSCNSCKYNYSNYVSDIVIGDFWGIERDYYDYDDKKGVSIVLTGSEKGYEMIEYIKDYSTIVEISGCSYLQPRMLMPTKKNQKKDVFFKMIEGKNGYIKAAKRYTDYGFVNRVLHKLMRELNKIEGKRL